MNGPAAPLVVLDDDPTGVQTLTGVRVLLAWDAAAIGRALHGRLAVHLITNSRALPPNEARSLVGAAARLARQAAPGADIILRGDSTLRGHVREEYEALRDAVLPGGRPPLLLVPALPSAGRVTIGGVHLLERDGRRVPLHETEYAGDGVFAYGNANLLAWAEERSHGLFPAAAGWELPLAEVRAAGSAAVSDALGRLARAEQEAVLVPDVETVGDLEAVARGYVRAARRGIRALVRCAPAFAGVLAGTTASGSVDAPRATDGLLVVCGSYTPTTTRQLRRLALSRPGTLVEVDVGLLVSDCPDSEIDRATRDLSSRLRRTGLAVLATPRERSAATATLAAGSRIASALATIAAGVEPRPGVVIAKGGITSAVTLTDGFGVSEADVVGPVLPGVSHWRAQSLDYLVVPGNIGDDALLVDLVDRVRGE